MNLFEYTWKQHFQFGYAKPGRPLLRENVRWLAKRQQPDEVFVAKYGRSQSVFPSWRDANCEAARRILLKCHELSLRPLILYSGGLDSEIVLLSFLEARRSLSAQGHLPHDLAMDVATFRLAHDLNRHDIEYVGKFRSRLNEFGHSEAGLSFHERELDPIQYWQTDEFMKLALQTQTVSPIVVCQMWLCEQMLSERSDYLSIIGQGEIHLVKQTPNDYEPGISPYLPTSWSIVETENLCGLYRFFIERGQPAIPGFFQYLPEQFESQLRTNRVLHELIATQRIGKLGTRSSKPEILAFDYPELEKRPKFHGFETIEAEHDRVRKHLGTVMAECEGHWYKEVFELYRDVRPPEPESHTPFGDCRFLLGKPGEPSRARRLDVHDIFATEWGNSESFFKSWNAASHISLEAAGEHFTEMVRKFLRSHPDAALFHDGSPLATWIHSLLRESTSSEIRIVDARTIPRLTAHEVCRDLFTTELSGDVDLYLQFKACAAFLENNSGSLILPRWNPRLHSESIFRSNVSYSWIESEKESRLLASLASLVGPQALSRIVCPWTNQDIVSAGISLLRKLHHVDQSEQKADCSSWPEWLARQAERVSESSEVQQTSQLSKTRYEAVRHRTQGLLDQVPHPKLPYMNSTTVLRLDRDLSSAPKLKTGIAAIRRSLSAHGLHELSLSDWIELATVGAKDFRLGGNLFYRQTIRGRDLLSQDSRIAIALRRDGQIVSAALLQVLDPDGENDRGVLRIRAVTTNFEARQRGFAKELLKLLTKAAGETLSTSFKRIEVWAAPEITSSFLAAGFQPASHLQDRAELVHDVHLDRLIESDRRLQPLIFELPGHRL